MSSGGKGKKSAVVGYRYYLGVHAALCHGPVDAITEIIVGERTAWSGAQTSNGTISINQPNLFGGDKREGGVSGAVDVLMGVASQPRNAYLAANQGANCPAYRGFTSLVFKSFMWAAMNPYFKAPWVRCRRILQGWNTEVFDSSRATINTQDMNPAHIIYQCLTDPKWGMGYNPSDIDTTSFQAASITLHSEGFGLSIAWRDQTQISEFVQTILDHINGSLQLDLSTGKFMLKLIRDDYSIPSLTLIDESNILELRSFERASYGEFANELVVEYMDRDDNPKTVVAQNLASVQAQGSVVSTTRQYPGIRTAALASRVAVRDLAVLSTPLAKLSVTTNRVLWEKGVGDVVRFSWADLSIVDAPFRIVSIDKGTLQNGVISVELVEDVFGLSASSYIGDQGSLWEDVAKAPVPVEAARVVESPFWEIALNVSLADQAYLQPEYGFGQVLATHGAINNPFNFAVAVSSSSGGTYTEVATAAFSPTGVLQSDITRTQTSFSLTSFYDLDLAELDVDNGYAYIENECVAVVSVDAETGAIVVRRGVLDTVPANHVAGTRMYFNISTNGNDPTERVAGEVAYYKPLPVTSYGTLEASSATALPITFNNRASRPYPPGQFKINGTYWPNNIDGAVPSVSWVGRDRSQQTVSLVDYSQANIGPEAGTTYTLRIYDGVTLKRTYTEATSAWTYPNVDQIADGFLQTVRITLVSVVGGVESLYPHDHTFERYGLGFHLGDSLGGVAPA